ncbi:MAG: bifunctional 4-hydroxy-2-oxoglutarate aldolase/2-dehydro-3-deoxy-phosphogluconate aldolase [Clostridia bacterium]|nr:bifunctional 4-hydroxy-2-oxoglutarate aldolase/2-dehydro-3-deoxy-phosphogluconate aldolase [Clostridia bacterium]
MERNEIHTCKATTDLRNEIIGAIETHKIIVILRGLTTEQLLATAEAMWQGGIRLIEVTFDQSGKISDEQTAANIRALVNTFAGRMHVGAGTVMTRSQLELARDAGASFIISPDACEEIIRHTRALGLVSLPGAFTPTEAANAYRWGADFVKLFPNSEVGISYLKALMAPLSHIRFLAVGGVNERNMRDYLDAGACGIGVATGIVNKQRIAEGDYAAITELARAYTSQL